jgi:hypothetical protein
MRGHHRPKCAVTIPKSAVTMGRNTQDIARAGLQSRRAGQAALPAQAARDLCT